VAHGRVRAAQAGRGAGKAHFTGHSATAIIIGQKIGAPGTQRRVPWADRRAARVDSDRSCEIPISHALFAGFPSCEVAGRDSRQSGCENGFSHQQLCHWRPARQCLVQDRVRDYICVQRPGGTG